MPSGCALILTSSISTTTSSSGCSGEGTKRTYQVLGECLMLGAQSGHWPKHRCRKLTDAPQQRPALFDHFVDDRVYPWRYPDALAPKHTREASGRSGTFPARFGCSVTCF